MIIYIVEAKKVFVTLVSYQGRLMTTWAQNILYMPVNRANIAVDFTFQYYIINNSKCSANQALFFSSWEKTDMRILYTKESLILKK